MGKRDLKLKMRRKKSKMRRRKKGKMRRKKRGSQITGILQLDGQYNKDLDI